MAPWRSGLTHQPFTLAFRGSNPLGVTKKKYHLSTLAVDGFLLLPGLMMVIGYAGYWVADEIDVSSLSGEEKLLLDSIVRHVCCHSGKTLESFTHTETPWVAARAGLPADASSNRIIEKQAIGEYFTSVKEKYRMLTPVNVKDYTRDFVFTIIKGIFCPTRENSLCCGEYPGMYKFLGGIYLWNGEIYRREIASAIFVPGPAPNPIVWRAGPSGLVLENRE